MKTRVVLIVGCLLLAGMLLVNLVLMIFWQRDASRREVRHDQAVLAHVFSILPDDSAGLYRLSSDTFRFSDFYSNGETGHIVLFFNRDTGINPALLTAEDISVTIRNDVDFMKPLLAAAIADTMQTGREVVHYSGAFPGLIHFRSHAIVTVRPILHRQTVIGAVAIAHSLESLFQTLWRAEKLVLIYILVNLLALLVIGFFRMVTLIVRPIEELVELADQYNRQDVVLFAAGNSGSEFNVLSNSLNSMLTRIEHDRQSLEQTVVELGAANQKLKSQQHEMIRTEKLASVGRMAAGLAHEIGNPLGVVQGYLGLLAQSGQQSAEHCDFIRRAEEELVRVNSLIRQMLDFARADKGLPENFSVHSLLRSVVEMVQVQSVFKGIQVSSLLLAEQDTVHADQDQIHQVLVNCLLNSADAVAEHVGSGRISITSTLCCLPDRVQEEYICIRIADNGIGVAEEDLDVIFDPFYTTKEPGKGTGLGLSVSLSIIESIGGRIEITSKKWKGSELRLFLPLVQR
jgi:signal transduction histidine kinase